MPALRLFTRIVSTGFHQVSGIIPGGSMHLAASKVLFVIRDYMPMNQNPQQVHSLRHVTVPAVTIMPEIIATVLRDAFFCGEYAPRQASQVPVALSASVVDHRHALDSPRTGSPTADGSDSETSAAIPGIFHLQERIAKAC